MSRTTRLFALVALVALAGCGTRVSDARIRAAAGIVAPVTAGSSTALAPGAVSSVPGTSGGSGGTGGSTTFSAPIPGTGPTASAAPGAAAATRPGAAASGVTGPAIPRPGGAITSCAGQATGTPVVAGVVGTFSGPVGTAIGDTATAIRIWAQYTNAHGGVNCHPVQIVVGDDQGDPARFNSLVQQISEQDGAIGFVFTSLGLSAGGNNSYLDSHHILTFGTEGGLDEAYSDPYLPTPIAAGHTYADSMIYAFSQVEIPAGHIKLATLACSDFSLCDNFDQEWSSPSIQQGTGFQVVYRSRPSLVQPDFTAQCLGAMQAGAQAVILGMDTASIQRFADACARQGYHPTLGVADLLALPSLPKDPNADGAVVGTKIAPFVDLQVPGIAKMYEAYHEYAPALVPSGSSTAGWVFAEFFGAAAAHLPARPTSQDLIDGLYQIRNNDLEGLTYPLTFTGTGVTAEDLLRHRPGQGRQIRPGPGAPFQCK